jgi:hypothetical protein
VFCGTAGSLSDEHMVPKWLRKALQIREQVREFSGTAYVGAAETLAIVFHEMCVSCNRGWMERLERDARPVLGPLLLGPRRVRRVCWIPVSTLQWLYRHHESRTPAPRHPGVDGRLQHFRPSRVDPGRVPV